MLTVRPAWARMLELATVAVVAVVVAYLVAAIGKRMQVGWAMVFAVPVVFVFAYLLMVRKEWVLAAVLLVRPAVDPIMGAMKSDQGMGPGAIFNAAVVLLCALFALQNPRQLTRPQGLIWIPFLALVGLGWINSTDQANTGRQFFGYLTFAGVSVIPFVIVRNDLDVRRWVKVLLLASVIPTVIAYADVLSGGQAFQAHAEAAMLEESRPGESLEAFELDGGSGFRIQGVFPHPNMLAVYLLSVIACVMYLRYSRWSPGGWKYRLAVTVYGLIQLPLLIFTQTRSVWISVVIMLAAMAWFVDRKLFRYGLILALLSLLLPPVQDRILDLFQNKATVDPHRLNSYEWRLALWSYAFPWIQEQWLTGWGLDTFRRYSTVFFPLEASRGFDAHNVFVQFAFEIGIPGAVAYALLFLVPLVASLINRASVATVPAVLMGSVSAAYLLVSYSDNMHRYLVPNWYLFFFIGLMGAAMRVAGRSTPGFNRQPA